MKSFASINVLPGVVLDCNTHELKFLNDQSMVRLEPLCSRLLEAITLKRGALATREELIAKVWDGNEGVGKTALTKNIYKLRKIFEQHLGKGVIETIPKKGYRIKNGVLKDTKRKQGWNTSKLVQLSIASGVALFIVLKLTNPGIFHMFLHRMGH